MRCDLVPKLDEYLAKVATMPFEWGKSDCGLFVCGWILLATEDDIQERVGCWSNELEAQNVIASHGGSLRTLVDKFLPPMPLVRARVGDIVHLTQQGQADGPLGICLGQTSAFLTETIGFSRVKTKNCDRAWMVA